MSKVVIASACRTAMGKFQGSLSSIKATDLGAMVVKEAIERAKIQPEWIDEVISSALTEEPIPSSKKVKSQKSKNPAKSENKQPH